MAKHDWSASKRTLASGRKVPVRAHPKEIGRASKGKEASLKGQKEYEARRRETLDAAMRAEQKAIEDEKREADDFKANRRKRHEKKVAETATEMLYATEPKEEERWEGEGYEYGYWSFAQDRVLTAWRDALTEHDLLLEDDDISKVAREFMPDYITEAADRAERICVRAQAVHSGIDLTERKQIAFSYAEEADRLLCSAGTDGKPAVLEADINEVAAKVAVREMCADVKLDDSTRERIEKVTCGYLREAHLRREAFVEQHGNYYNG